MVDDYNSEPNHLDDLTRYRMLGQYNSIRNAQLIDKITALAFVVGMIFGVIIASFLHKYIVHPLGF